jgi:beta-glucosidase
MLDKSKLQLTPELKKRFPGDFMWGASISPHQVEGDSYNQWTKWELETAKQSANSAESKWSKILPIWDDVRAQATDPNNYVSGHGDKHYKLYEQDFKLAKSLGLNTFRFSLEWSRIEPEEGVYNIEALRHYKRYIAALIDAGLTPIVGLWHWTHPVWFEEKGGFSKKANLIHWRKYVEKVADELDWSEVKYANSLNEANMYTIESYYLKDFPPAKGGLLKTLITYNNLALAHRIAYRTLTNRHSHLSVGIVHQFVNYQPKNRSKFSDRTLSWVLDQFVNWWFLRRCRRFDFVGLNYYRTEYIEWFKIMGKNPSAPVNDMGWYMEPKGIEHVINETWSRFKKPIIVTENGVADMHDKYRLWWLTETMHAIDRAQSNGVKLLGYCHWSLLDNFEWQYGWIPKFGLVAVDRQSSQRTVKHSARIWSNWLLHR